MHYNALVVAKNLEAEAGELGRLIGNRVRQHRTGRGWTLDELARRAGVSKRMLSSIELGGANPSIATLLRISDALGAGLPGLIEAGHPAAARVTRAGQAPQLWQGPHGGHASLVAGTEPPEVVELWDWSLGPGDAHHTEPHAAGTRELILVLDGRIQLRVGSAVHVLGPGDSAAFRGDVPHGYANPAGRGDTGPAARFALTVFEPHVDG
jgi:DNA-binding XRE family transcriptional regulator/mannose-6-phosphate isomerase-like protein (cupin superfamily)